MYFIPWEISTILTESFIFNETKVVLFSKHSNNPNITAGTIHYVVHCKIYNIKKDVISLLMR